ncbi:hypothetical protein GCM10023172_00330 [Hymenobacter ginsengisoli]|uniref:Uncharacterized protein n=1 Tax=Hymenobacter ginsengisoli TaxID=1051626 RepID=A0ABP8PU55_9BACT
MSKPIYPTSSVPSKAVVLRAAPPGIQVNPFWSTNSLYVVFRYCPSVRPFSPINQLTTYAQHLQILAVFYLPRVLMAVPALVSGWWLIGRASQLVGYGPP